MHAITVNMTISCVYCRVITSQEMVHVQFLVLHPPRKPNPLQDADLQVPHYTSQCKHRHKGSDFCPGSRHATQVTHVKLPYR